MLSKYWTSIRDSRVETLGGCLSGCSAGEYDKGTCILLSMSVRTHETQICKLLLSADSEAPNLALPFLTQTLS